MGVMDKGRPQMDQLAFQEAGELDAAPRACIFACMVYGIETEAALGRRRPVSAFLCSLSALKSPVCSMTLEGGVMR
jgi:hypothetical protein